MVLSFVSCVGHFPSISLFLERTRVCKLLSAMFYTSSFYHICWLCCFSTYLVIVLSFDLSVPEMGICIKSLTMVVNVTVTFVNSIKTSFQLKWISGIPWHSSSQDFHCHGPGFNPWLGNWDLANCAWQPPQKRNEYMCVCMYGRGRLFIELIQLINWLINSILFNPILID